MSVKKNELKNLNKEESVKKMKELRMELMKLRAQVARGTPPENPGKIKAIRKTIARILTYQNQKKKEEVKKGK